MSTCWADPLTKAERRYLAMRLASAALRFGAGARESHRVRLHENVAGLNLASAEMADLRIDVTERAEVAAS